MYGYEGVTDIYISPEGNNRWNGLKKQHEPGTSNGPLATIQFAQFLIREMKQRGMINAPVTIWLCGGRYHIETPIEFGPQDSASVTFRACPGETPVIDGSIPLTEWETTTVNCVTAWKADVSAILARHASIHSLFANGKRCPRARWPKKDYFIMEDVPESPEKPELFDGGYRFVAKEGDFHSWRNLSDIDVCVPHYWIQERMPVTSYDETTRTVECSRRSMFSLKNAYNQSFSQYFLENVYEAVKEPGEWYFDREDRSVLYIPRDGETLENTTITVPVAYQLLRLVGTPWENSFVENISFHGISFEYTDWYSVAGHWGKYVDPYISSEKWRNCDSSRHFYEYDGADPHADYAAVPQGEYHLPGVIFMRGARSIVFSECRFAHLGFYAMDMQEGCQSNRVEHCLFEDLGAGAIKMNGDSKGNDLRLRTRGNVITDNHVRSGGWIFPSSCGIISLHADRIVIAHNEIHDLCYSGISCGWVWGQGRNTSRDNFIHHNHIYNLGRRSALSDMGGIYLLGVQPGTFIYNNLIHDIDKAAYGGWGLYPDEGSSCMVFEKNIIFNTNSHSMHEHWGRQNIYRNNIFAFGGEGILTMNNEEHHEWADYPPKGCTVERNIFVTKGMHIWHDNDGYLEQGILTSDLNIYWDYAAEKPLIYFYEPHHHPEKNKKLYLEDMQELGLECHSICTDPLFTDPEKGDFTIADDSPAHKVGFKQIDVSTIGPRPKQF